MSSEEIEGEQRTHIRCALDRELRGKWEGGGRRGTVSGGKNEEIETVG